MNKFCRFLLSTLFLFVLFSYGCVSVDGARTGIKSSLVENSYNPIAAQISIFLSVTNNNASPLSLNITSLEIGDGLHWQSILVGETYVNSVDIGHGQLLLNRASVSPGTYDRLRFQFKDPILLETGNELSFDPSIKYEVMISPLLLLAKKDSTSLFLSLDLQQSIAENDTKFSPSFTANVQTIPLTTELAYVSCPDIQTIYIIRTDNNFICGSWGIDGKPTYLAAFKEKDELLILMSDQAAIKKIELSSGRIKDIIKIPTIISPLFMVLDDEAQFAYILDQKSNYLVKMDLKSGGLLTRVRLTDRPNFLHYLSGQNQVAVSSTLSQKIFLLDANTLSTLSTLSSSSSPRGLFFKDTNLYIAEGRANTVQVIDINSGRIQRRNVGRSPRRFIANDKYLYVANHDSGTVSILLPGQVNIIGDIQVDGNPEEMAISTSRNWLYINDKRGEGVSVVDLTSHRLAEKIKLMSSPFDIEVIQ